MSRVKKLLLFACGLFVLSVVYQSDKANERRAARTPEQVAADEKEAAQEAARSGAVQAAVVQLKQGLRDPDSLVVESARVAVDAAQVCIEYRAKNGFGGTNKEFVVFTSKKAYPNNVPVWNKTCLGSMRDYTRLAK